MINAATVGETLAAAFTDLAPALRSWFGWLLAFAAMLLVYGIAGGGWTLGASPGPPSPLQAALTFGIAIPVSIATTVFSVAAAVRRVQPSFRMTPGRAVAFVGWSFGTAVFIFLGMLALVLPGIYLAARIGLRPVILLLDDSGENALTRTFRATGKAFFPTLLLWLSVWLVELPFSLLLVFIAFKVPSTAPAAKIAASFGANLVSIAVTQFSYAAQVRWSSILLDADQRNDWVSQLER